MVSNQVVCAYLVAVIYCCIHNQPKLSLCVFGSSSVRNPEGLTGLRSLGGGWAQGHHRCKVPLRCLSVLQSQGNQASCGGAPRARPASQAGAQSLLCPALILRRGHTPHLVTEEADRSIRPSIPSGRAHDTPDSALLGVIKSS